MTSNWEPVVGIEVHVQLATRSKIFSTTSVEFGAAPNVRANLIDLAMPGALPVLNEEAVTMAVKFGLAINAEIAETCVFDRKNYFYPDLPKGYQISQFDSPIVGRGQLAVLLEDGSVREIGITRAHLEEDAGKSVHDRFAESTGIDLNRAGTPLLEIVTEPDMRSAAEAAACFRQIHSLVSWLDICDGNLAEGSMRCDANVSVRKVGDETFGERTEIKNINSFRFVERALNYEIERQIDVLERGGEIVRETRQYDADRDVTLSMRSKELSDDYRYFPDPDLLPLRLSSTFLETVRSTMPELPEQKLERFVSDYTLAPPVAVRLTRDHNIATFYESTVELGADPQQSANWLLGEVAAALNREERDYSDVPVSPKQLADLIARIQDKTLSSSLAKEVFERIWSSDDPVDEIIERRGLRQLSDVEELRALIQRIIEEHPDQVEQVRGGATKVLGYLIGQVMKASQGKADPRQVNELLKGMLNI
ncbi:MAG: Asp-tRNA(Asn)/Glu-tRNA(Gln) amidotransferase subunit GatB [Gammaproteobacteria bacterium]|nr:Asp-tRNA(Asn)/Glu-tRNA(Gln) amidotransferase subunit GatB [Gammaproteobacteria bacterium]